VRIRPRAIGICQTDVNLLRLGPRAVTLGHEIAGITDDGTPVAIEPLVPCGACAQCEVGDTQWCDENFMRIAGVGFDGGMADELILPERCIVPLPSTLPVGDASLCEPLAVNLHSLALARLEGRMRVAVCGAGITGFGLLGAAGALWRGCRVDVETPEDHMLAAADRLGAGTQASGTYDLVIEGDGSEESIARAAELCRPGGTVLLVAGYYSDKTFRVLPYVVKELTVVWGTFYGHHAAGRAFDNAAMLLAQRPEIAKAMITHRFPLDAAAEAFATVTGPDPSIKVVVEPYANW
jgi:threonine dehydrogenase-like Zn-dependent dehydrogenase